MSASSKAAHQGYSTNLERATASAASITVDAAFEAAATAASSSFVFLYS